MKTEKNIKVNKFWLSKDKFISRFKASKGPNHWYLKKFIVLYFFFLVNRRDVKESTFKEIADIFSSFINSIDNKNLRKDAENYFFSPIDLRKENILNFKKFNDVERKDDAARKYFVAQILGIGGQSGIKKLINKDIFEIENFTMSELIEKIPIYKRTLIDKAKKNGEDPNAINGLDDKINTILSDGAAEIRNYRQLLSYFGIVPPKDEGYVLNDISHLLIDADSDLVWAIWEHQKFKLRYYNPFIAKNDFTKFEMDEEVENYQEKKDFYDFKVNPYTGILKTLEKLKKHSPKHAYINLDEYKCFIAREAPFNLEKIVNKILHFRTLSIQKQEDVVSSYHGIRKESRKTTKKATSEDFHKELSNQIFGIRADDYRKDFDIFSNILNYESKKITILNDELFDIYFTFVIKVENYLNNKYEDLYIDISNYCSYEMVEKLQLNNEHNKNDSKYEEKLKNIKKNFNRNDDTYANWYEYITEFDFHLLIVIYSSNLLFNNYLHFQNEKNISKFSKIFTETLSDFTGMSKDKLIPVIERIIKNILARKELFEFENMPFTNNLEGLNEESINDLPKADSVSLSVLIEEIQSERQKLRYEFQQGDRIRKRDARIMKLVRENRLNNNIILETKKEKYPVGCCDVCGEKFKFGKGEPQCHHIIPFEFEGPDDTFNYCFLCKGCHDLFTHDTNPQKTLKAIKTLKVKGLFSKKNLYQLHNKGLLNKKHIKYLHSKGFIHTITLLDLYRKIDEAIKAPIDVYEDEMVGEKRWPRGMREVFHYRLKKRVMEKNMTGFQGELCDGCDKNLIVEGKPSMECHHIIPKKEVEEVEGPESPYNYAYLCRDCHLKLTPYKKQKKGSIEVIENLKKKGIVSEETITQMILDSEISYKELEFFKDYNFINHQEHEGLVELLKEKEKYSKL